MRCTLYHLPFHHLASPCLECQDNSNLSAHVRDVTCTQDHVLSIRSSCCRLDSEGGTDTAAGVAGAHRRGADAVVRGRAGGECGHAGGRLHARAAHGLRPQGAPSPHLIDRNARSQRLRACGGSPDFWVHAGLLVGADGTKQSCHAEAPTQAVYKHLPGPGVLHLWLWLKAHDPTFSRLPAAGLKAL